MVFKIGLGSTSSIKRIALEEALKECCPPYNEDYEIIEMKVESEVDEQPFGEAMILKGLFNRLHNSYSIYPQCHLYIAMENGIIETTNNPETSKYFDWGYVGYFNPSFKLFEYEVSAPCEFPADAVFETMEKEGGFKLHTVGKTLLQKGLVKNHTDPHIDLLGISRKDLLKQALIELLSVY